MASSRCFGVSGWAWALRHEEYAMFGFAHNGHGALADERDGHRVEAHAVWAALKRAEA